VFCTPRRLPQPRQIPPHKYFCSGDVATTRPRLFRVRRSFSCASL
jgi:hypothetical protein